MRATHHFAIALLACALCANAGDERVAPAGGARPYASAGKLGGPLELRYVFATKPRMGESFLLDLSAIATSALSGVRLEANLDDGLQLTSGSTERAWESGPLDAGATMGERLDIAVLEPGLHYVHVVARISIGDRHSARTIAIPVQVGEATQHKSAGEVGLDERGERIVSLPAS